MSRLLLADGSSQIYRTFHALARGPGLRMAAPDGTPTGALLTFLRGLRKAIRDHEPNYVAVTFDRDDATFRHDLLGSYKAQRQAMPEELAIQVNLAREALAALRIPLIEMPGWEADDVIATLTRRATDAGHDVVILTSDKDMLQLVRPGVRMHHGLRDEILDVAGAEKYFGAPPERVPDVLALQGDASDNIPGVPGIGDKSARELVKHYGNLDTILASTIAIAADERLGRLRKRLAELVTKHANEARLARVLVTLREDAPVELTLESLAVCPPDAEACGALFGRLGFGRFLDELGITAQAPERQLADASSSRATYRTVRTTDELTALAERLRRAPRFALDTETNSRDAMTAKLVGIAVSTAAGEGDYVPVGHAEPGSSLDLDVVRKTLGPILADPNVVKVGQNCKFDVEVLARHGMPVDGLAFDSMIASYLLDSQRRSHDLDSLAADHLAYKTISFAEVAGTGADEKTLDEVSVDAVARYSGEDADVALRLAAKLQPMLAPAGLARLFTEIEMPLIPVLADMEMTGVGVDAGALEALKVELDQRLAELTLECHRHAGHEFNIASPKQLAAVLFDELGLSPRARTAKTGARSTSVEVLEHLALEHPICQAVLEHRELTKLVGTYVDVLPRLVNPRTGRVHTSYNQVVAATGRLSSSDPNLQNIPIRTELGRRVRKAFVPKEGNLLVGADYSQVELRIMAHLSGDDALCDAFARGEDIHAATASHMFGVPVADVSDDMRRRAKVINFGVLYGMTAHGVAQRLGCTRTEGQALIDRYFGSYPRMKETIDRIVTEVRADPKHEARTLFGRSRAFPDIVSKNLGQRQFAERSAVNTVVQGTAADLMKLAMIALWQRLRWEHPRAKLIIQVHDELVVEAPRAEAEDVLRVLTESMERVYPLRAALRAVGAVGASWYEL